MSIRAFAPFVTCLAAPLTAQVVTREATRDTARAAPVIVSATRLPMSQRSLPVAVTVITREELELRGIATVADAIADASSAYVARTGSQGSLTSVFLRGGESKYVKVLIDGVPVNDPGGAYDFGSLTTDNVERIEIVRGPASVIHGPDAVTGVVNVLTRRGQASAVEADVRVGSMPRDRRLNGGTGFGQGNSTTLDARVGAYAMISGGAFSLSVARHLSEGLYELNNDFANNVVSASYDLLPSATTRVRLTGRYTDYRFDYPTNGGGDVLDTNAFRTEDRTALGAVIERQMSDANRLTLALTMSGAAGATDDQVDGAGGSSFVSLERTRRRGAELRHQILIRHGIATTIGLQFEQQDQRTQFQSDGPFGPYNDKFAASRRNLGLYGELVAELPSALTLTFGLRADSNEQFGGFATGRGGVSWRPVPGTRIRATGGTAFREPTFLENYSTGFVTGNPSLEPERTRSFDAGLDQELLGGRVQAGVTAFAQRFRNMIDYEPTATSCGFSYCNVAEATSNGVELEMRARLAGPLFASVGATFLETRVIEPGFDVTSGGLYRRDEPLIRRPERNITAELSYRGRGPLAALSASLRGQAVGIRHDRDFRAFPATPVALPSYERLDLSAEYAFVLRNTKRSALTLRIENLGNAYYESVFNFLTPRRTIALGFRTSS